MTRVEGVLVFSPGAVRHPLYLSQWRHGLKDWTKMAIGE